MKKLILILLLFYSISLLSQIKIDTSLKDHPFAPSIVGSQLLYKDVYENADYPLLSCKIITTAEGKKFRRPNDILLNGKVTRLTYIMGETMQSQLNEYNGRKWISNIYQNFPQTEGFKLHSYLGIREFNRYKEISNHPYSHLIEHIDLESYQVYDAIYYSCYKKNTIDSIYVVYVFSTVRRVTNYYFIDVIEIPLKLTEKKVVDVLMQEGRIEIHDILFEIGSEKILEQSQKHIDVLAKVLMNNTELRILIIGHTDNIGDVRSNLNLSQRRADAIAKILIDKYNISPERLATKGLGEAEPSSDNNTKEGRKLNRRIEVVKLE